VPKRGRIIAFDTGKSLETCLAKAFSPVERYGTTEGSTWRIANIKVGPEGTQWSIFKDGQIWADMEFSLAGEYNVRNATAAAALASAYGISKDKIQSALKSFKSVKRRLEVRAQVAGVTVIDDFAHHPTAIRETIMALRGRYPGSRLWAILEPRSNTMRRKVLQDDLADSLGLADEVIIANVFKSEAIPEIERLDLRHVIAKVQKGGPRARILADADSIVDIAAPEMKSKDVVVILSNGGFGGIYEKLPKRLKELSQGANGSQELSSNA